MIPVEDTVRTRLEGQRFRDVRWVAETGSTNADLMEIGRAGGDEQVLITDYQSAGRGRLARSWEAPPGSSLLVSVLVRRDAEAANSALQPPAAHRPAPHTMVSAVALAATDAVQIAADVRAEIKWPNDLVIDGRKLAGILAESHVVDGRVGFVVVGMGMNVNWPTPLPDALAETATSLNQHRPPSVDRVDLVVALLERLAYWLQSDPAHLAGAYRSRSATIGSRVRIISADGEREAVAVDVDDGGRLVVESETGREAVDVADIVHLRPAGPA